jgi:hypothetical protein
LKDVKEWIDNESAEYVLPHLNIRGWFTRSHPPKRENPKNPFTVVIFNVVFGRSNVLF